MDTWGRYQKLLQTGMPACDALREALQPEALPVPERVIAPRETKRRASRIAKFNRKAARR
jgi:hypothetical protein